MNHGNWKKVLNKKITMPIFLFLFIRITIPLVTNYFKLLEKCFNKDYSLIEVRSVLDCIKIVLNNKIIGIISLTATLILCFITFNIYFTVKRRKIENEGIRIKEKDGTHGTANFINPHDIKELSIGKEATTPGVILGKTIDTDEIIVLPDKFKERNRNIMIWGASGSRKVNRVHNTKCLEGYRTRKLY